MCCSTDLKRFPELSILLKRGLTNPKEVNWEQTKFVLVVALSNSALTDKRKWKMKQEAIT